MSGSQLKPSQVERPQLVVFVQDPAQPAAPPPPRDEATQQEAYKDALLGVLGHELRTPLHVIAGLYDMLSDDAVATLDEAQRVYVEALGQQLDGLVRIIGDLLDASALTAGDLPLWKDAVRLPELVTDVLALMGPQAAGRGVSLVGAVPPMLPAVRGDEARIAQVLTRLLANAIAFTPAGGQVSVEAAVRDGFVHVEVADAGDGIAVQDQGKLFQRFKQLDMSRTRPHGGLGMGLFLCRRLIEAHGGRIGIRSQPGAGSTFWFTLPLS